MTIMAKEKSKGNNGGSNGDGGTPAEASATETQSVADATPSPPNEQPTTPAELAPVAVEPPQAEPAVMAQTTDELKRAWAAERAEIEACERSLVFRRVGLRVVEQELCERAKRLADAQGAEPIVTIGGRRMKVKSRPAKHGGGLHFVDAPVNAAIDL
jgi:hypothetical protein